MEDEIEYYEYDLLLRPSCYALTMFEHDEPISANDEDFETIETAQETEYENLYAMPV